MRPCQRYCPRAKATSDAKKRTVTAATATLSVSKTSEPVSTRAFLFPGTDGPQPSGLLYSGDPAAGAAGLVFPAAMEPEILLGSAADQPFQGRREALRDRPDGVRLPLISFG